MTDPCPCNSGLAYEHCCERYHRGPLRLQAPSPEALMRSRYSAFVRDELDYLLATWHPDTRPARLEPNEHGTRWLGLEIRRADQGSATHGTVEFVARVRHQGKASRLHECSRFVFENGQWFYVDGEFKTP